MTIAPSVLKDNPASHLRNALQVLQGTDPFKLSPLEVHQNLLAVEARCMEAVRQLEAR